MNTALPKQIFATLCVLFFGGPLAAETPAELRIGRAGHAFDHLGGIGEQAEAAAASGSTIIYATGLGGVGYTGMPPQRDFQTLCDQVSAYNRQAKSKGIELSLGYLCATSIVKLESFDKNWTPEFRAQFKTRPADWRQQDTNGKPLASWYGGDYQPACMNNPEWRAYERAMVRHQLETGHDGIFDNPTVHTQGCYCPHCMERFEEFVKKSSPLAPRKENVPRSGKATLAADVETLRKLADANPKEFFRFRTTIARDFLADMRKHARTINPKALVTCNNSLNAPTVFFSQCRLYGYNIEEMSKVEDLVVVEDMATSPRTEANGQSVEYGPIYKQLHAISHGKPVVAVTLASGDYHTPPNLMRLAMAEAAAHNASYLAWPTWPDDQRKRMIAGVRPQAEFLRRNEELLNDAPFRADVALYQPFHRWVETDHCAVTGLASALTKENIQYKVIGTDEMEALSKQPLRPVLVVESRSVIGTDQEAAVAKFEKQGPGVIAADKPDWLPQLRLKIAKSSVSVKNSPSVRAVVHHQPGRTIVHLYNLNVQRVSTFEDKVTPATNVALGIMTPVSARSVSIRTADEKTTSGPLKFEALHEGSGTLVLTSVPRLDISALVIIEK